jgi:L-2-hydroxyglutarate oxidase LhgO
MGGELRHDVCIVGAGLVGLSVGRAVQDQYPGSSVVVVDKEDRIAAHQSSHNSGVAHSGLYYRPGSLKARLCVEGRAELERLCDSASIPFRRLGKLVIATDPAEFGALDELERRGHANGLAGLRRLNLDGIREIEPAATGLQGLHVPEAGVVDFPGVARHLADELQRNDAEVRTGVAVTAIAQIPNGARVVAGGQEVRARIVVNCAGLHSDRVAALAGVVSDISIVPFRGEYYTLDPEVSHLVRGLVYPVPDPRFPFLGVHFTRRVDDSVEVGPNAVLALGREQYRGSSIGWGDLIEVMALRGFWKLAGRHWRTGGAEVLRSKSRALYARSAQRMIPALRSDDLRHGGVGVRAQALGRDGRLVDDFVIEEVGATLHVLNAPSPGATASLAIGAHIAGLLRPQLTGLTGGRGV